MPGTASPSTTSYTQAESPLRFRSSGLGEDDLLIVGLRGTEGLSQLYEFTLDLLAPTTTAISFDAVLGRTAVVACEPVEGEPRWVHGIVSELVELDRNSDFISYRAVLVPQLWMTTKQLQSRIFQHTTIPDILKTLLAGYDVKFRIQGKYYPRDYCVQYRESDFAFLSRLMEEEGIWYYFVHNESKEALIVGDDPSGHVDVIGDKTIRYSAIPEGNEATTVIDRWHKTQKLSAGKVTLRDYCFEMPDKDLHAEVGLLGSVAVGSVTHKLLAQGVADVEIYDYPGGYAQRFDGIDRGGAEQPSDLQRIFEDNTRTAKIRIQQESMEALRIRARSNCLQITSGASFTLNNHDDGDGDYLITSVQHQFSSGGPYRSGDVTTLVIRNEFECLPAGLPFRPTRSTPRPVVRGTQTAMVVGPAGEEIFCDKYGRVKVQFHWDRDGKRDADSSCWIRVATIWAGKGYGVLHVPRIGQEVVVDFLEGDPDQPIIVGSVYNAEQMPPVKLPKERMFSGTRSNSSPGGGGFNGVVSNDTRGKELVTVNSQYDMKYHVGHNEVQTVDNNRKITVDGTHNETIKKDTSITVSDGKYEHNVATGTADYAVKGTLTETYSDAQITTTTKDVTLVSVEGDINQWAMAGAFSMFANKIVEVTSKTASVEITASTKILLSVGSSSILLEADGTITISGLKISISGSKECVLGTGSQSVTTDLAKVAVAGAEINASATGVHTIAGAVVKLN